VEKVRIRIGIILGYGGDISTEEAGSAVLVDSYARVVGLIGDRISARCGKVGYKFSFSKA